MWRRAKIRSEPCRKSIEQGDVADLPSLQQEDGSVDRASGRMALTDGHSSACPLDKGKAPEAKLLNYSTRRIAARNREACRGMLRQDQAGQPRQPVGQCGRRLAIIQVRLQVNHHMSLSLQKPGAAGCNLCLPCEIFAPESQALIADGSGYLDGRHRRAAAGNGEDRSGTPG